MDRINGQVPIIGQEAKIGVQWTQMPSATPLSLAVPSGGGATIYAFGGMTKLEEVASRIAGSVECREAEEFVIWADRVVNRARHLLAAIDRLQAEQVPLQGE